MPRSSEVTEMGYAVDMIKANIGKKVIVVLNFSGAQPPERRTFAGKIIAVGLDYFVLDVERTKNQIMAYFVNLAILAFDKNYPNLPLTNNSPTSTEIPSSQTVNQPFHQPVSSIPPYPAPNFWWHRR